MADLPAEIAAQGPKAIAAWQAEQANKKAAAPAKKEKKKAKSDGE